nr:PP2C family serine/threonine-protein phosphatase [Gordonia sp. LAM0048]
MTLVLRYIARSDRGLVRSNNEDSFYAGPRLLALADGMGGHAAGEVASQLVIRALSTLDDDEPGGDLLTQLDGATRAGNEAIAAQVHESPELDGMGTTLTAILFAGSRIGLCHIGDSRGYMFRDGALTQITRDDTFVQTLVDEGRITAEQAHTHPQRSLIMRALTGTEVEPTLTMREARAGDRYMLCSDGLSDVVTEETLAETLGSIADPKECADRLIELALRGGGPDNVTVVLADVVDTEYGDSRPIVGGAAGGNEEIYTPDPATAAGRAAALRPPPAEPQRPTVLTEDEPAAKHKSKYRRWIVAGVVLTVVAALVVGVFVVRSVVRSNYYVAADDSGDVLVYQGSPEKVFFLSMSNPVQRVCVEDLDQTEPTYTFISYDDGTCEFPLPLKRRRPGVGAGAVGQERDDPEQERAADPGRRHRRADLPLRQRALVGNARTDSPATGTVGVHTEHRPVRARTTRHRGARTGNPAAGCDRVGGSAHRQRRTFRHART